MTGDCCVSTFFGHSVDGRHLMRFQTFLEKAVSTGREISLQHNHILPLGVQGVS